MADRSILYRLRAALQGQFVAVAGEVQSLATYVGVLSGANNVETGLQRLDGTGVGASIFTFTGSYSAQASNIAEWFGGKQLVRMRCIDSGTGPSVSGAVPFDLPGSTALGTAFDTLVTNGLPEMITFIIEYTGPSDDFLQVRPRASGSGPQIGGTSAIIVRSGVAATIEVTRSSGTISDYVFRAIGAVGDGGNPTADTIRLINPSVGVWDASTNGTLPTTGVVTGNAYKVVNAPADGSGRFGEIMQNDDRVVWNGSTFTSWSAEPHQWFVLPAHDVRRITALEDEFLLGVTVTPESGRNTVVRGANYADSVNEIRLKIYTQRSDYSAADLNTTGDIDEFTDASDATGYLGIRLPGNLADLTSVLPTLYIYAEDGSGNFSRLLNMDADFTHQGDFGQESDYLSNDTINYNANDTLRIYVGSLEDRYTIADLDVFESNLSTGLQAKVNRTDGGGVNDESRIRTLESKVAALYPLTSYVDDLDQWGDIFDPALAAATVDITSGYSLIADYRGDATRYESAGVTYSDAGTNVVTYSGLGDNLFRGFGFKVDAPADQVLMWIVDGSDRIPYIDMTSGGNYRVNNYTPATTEDVAVRDQTHHITTFTGQTTLRAGTTDTATFTVTPFPANATQTSRFLQIGVDVLLNGSDTQAEHLAGVEDGITIPADNTAQAAQNFNASIYLGPLYNNRTVNVTMSYATRVSGSDLLVDVQLVTAPTDITIRVENVFVDLNYTAPATVARVDNFAILQDDLGDYTFTGANELLVTFHPFQDLNLINVVPVAVDNAGTIDQLNDTNSPIPAHNFESVEIPDQTTLTGFEFRTFAPEHYLRHSDLVTLLGRRTTQWCYGLALNRAITERAVTEPVDFTQGIILVSPDDSRWTITVANDGTLKTDPA